MCDIGAHLLPSPRQRHHLDLATRLARIEEVYVQIRRQAPICLGAARAILFDAQARTPQRERALLALVDHPDARATELLEHPLLSFDIPRLDLAHRVALKRRHRRVRQALTRLCYPTRGAA